MLGGVQTRLCHKRMSSNIMEKLHYNVGYKSSVHSGKSNILEIQPRCESGCWILEISKLNDAFVHCLFSCLEMKSNALHNELHKWHSWVQK